MSELEQATDLATERALESLEGLRRGYAIARRAGARRHRDIAAQLGVSEGELIAAHPAASGESPTRSAGLQARRLRGGWPQLVGSLESVGTVMALTRNPSCVHERVGIYREVSATGPAGREMGLVLGGAIDLRIFYSHWAHGFAVTEAHEGDVQRSFQFFDASGTAVHKVFMTPQTDRQAWARLVESFADDQAAPGMTATAPPARPAEAPDRSIDRAGFQQAWASMRDTHEFFGLLRSHGLSRTQALRLADPRFAQPVDPASAQQVLSVAAATGTPIMVFVGNPGMIQIHSGPVHKVAVTGPWLNVLDPGFNLHLREDHIARAWLVRKPTVDGLVSSLELFDASGETLAMFFGERKPGRPELCAWREILDGLLGERLSEGDAPCAA